MVRLQAEIGLTSPIPAWVPYKMSGASRSPQSNG